MIYIKLVVQIVFFQEDLLEILLDLPLKTMDEKLYLLAGKILLYYAENQQVNTYIDIYRHTDFGVYFIISKSGFSFKVHHITQQN